MKLKDFINMDEMEQAEAIWDGVHIADRDDGEYKIILYQIGSFYVEVYAFLRYKRFRSIFKYNRF